MKDSNYSTTTTSFGFHLSYLQISIVYYFGVIFGSAGLLLNIIGVIVFSRKIFSKKAIGIYNIIIAIVNICVIITSSISYMPLFFQQNPLLWSSASCKILNFSQHTFTVLSSLLDMMITFDRMIRISFPRRFERIKTHKGIIFISLGLFLLTIGLNSFCFEYKIRESNKRNSHIKLRCGLFNTLVEKYNYDHISYTIAFCSNDRFRYNPNL